MQALTSKGLVVLTQGRLAEARILLEAAAERANAEQLYGSALRAQNNLAVVLEASDRYAEGLELCNRSIALARRRGDRRWESNLRTGGLIELFMLGRWDEGLVLAAEETALAATQSAKASLLTAALIDCERGDLRTARARLAAAEELRQSDNSQNRVGFAGVEARILRAEGRNADALATAESVLPSISEISITDTNVKLNVVEAITSALALPDLDKAGRPLTIPESLDPGEVTPFLQASTAQLRARLDAALGNHEQVEGRFRTAVTLFREFGLVFHLAVTQLELGESFLKLGRAQAQALLAEAHRAFEELRATPWVERVRRAEAGLREVPVGG